ncbi:MAG: hypothetical protein KAR03_12050, partial [Candidatus Thorarchaeota archaeon]|nr:hypothetical protein [Candidatus Thorarchaeota archaeon]
ATEMDRIDREPEVHSASLHEDSETRTLYEMVTAWAEQPWDGIRYARIAEELWDSIDASNLMEGPYGVSVTLLESCIVDFTEALQTGQLTEEQGVDGLKKLLENDVFIVGARVIEVCVNTNPVCRISNADQLLNMSRSIDYRKPEWWARSVRSYWLSMGGVSVVSMIIIYGLMINLGLMQLNFLILSILVGIPMYAISFYLRTIPSRRLWRGIAIGMGACFIGLWFIFLPLVFLLSSLFVTLPWWLGMWVLPLSMVLGGFIGDWIGKRNDYMPYM